MVMPEPIVSGNGYRVRISDAGGDNVRCLDRFYLILLEDSAAGIGASINVVSSTSESITLAIGVWVRTFGTGLSRGSRLADEMSIGIIWPFLVNMMDCGAWE